MSYNAYKEYILAGGAVASKYVENISLTIGYIAYKCIYIMNMKLI